MASRKNTPTPLRTTVPQLDQVKRAIDDESNAARILHRMAQDLRGNPDVESLGSAATTDVDAMVGELWRLEQRLRALAESLDVPGGAEVIPLRPQVVA